MLPSYDNKSALEVDLEFCFHFRKFGAECDFLF